MKKTNKMLSSLLTMLVFSGTVNAAPYVLGQAGIYGLGSKNDYYNNIFDADKVRATGRLGAGYQWDLCEALGLGLEGAVNLNQKATNAIDVKRYSIDALGVVDWFVAQSQVDLFAKAGTAYAHSKSTVGPVKLTNEGFVPKAAVGVGYNVTANTNANLSLSHEFKRDSEGLASQSAMMLGLKYSFA